MTDQVTCPHCSPWEKGHGWTCPLCYNSKLVPAAMAVEYALTAVLVVLDVGEEGSRVRVDNLTAMRKRHGLL